MPHAIIKLWPGRNDEQKELIAKKIAEVVAETTGAEDKSVSVSIVEVEKEQWKEEVYDKDIVGQEEVLYKAPGYKY